MLDGIDEEAARAASRVIDRIPEVGVQHLDHHGSDLAGRSELAVQGGLTEVGQQVLEDVALDVGAEFGEVDAVDFVHHLLEHVGVNDLEHGVTEILGDLRLLLHQRSHVGKHMVAYEVAKHRAALETPLGPTETLGLFGIEPFAVAVGLLADEPLFEFAAGFLLVEQLKVNQIRNLLDIGNRIGDTAGPKDVGDPVQFSAQILVHRCSLCELLHEDRIVQILDDFLEPPLAEELNAQLCRIQNGERRLKQILQFDAAAGDTPVL